MTQSAAVKHRTPLERGWYKLSCGCHGTVFRHDLLSRIPKEAFEFCEITNMGGVKIEILRSLDDAEA